MLGCLMLSGVELLEAAVHTFDYQRIEIERVGVD
jgi:hypothetical protein